ncbi:hypothetical protein AB0911_35940 [Streptomyces nigra]|uniref:hypothetical protein n=1 Tax=Streptomyces nigra TaxID=1827580 RepID=UPI003451EA8E
MNDHEALSAPSSDASALEQAGIVFVPLIRRRYLRELARYRLLLGTEGHLPPDRAEALILWWETLSSIMANHHRALSQVLWELLHDKGPEFEGLVAAMNQRHTMLHSSRSEAGRALKSALREKGAPSSAQLSFIRFHEEVSATSFWEEREIVSRALRCLSSVDWQRVESYALASQAAEDRLGHALPWLLEDMPGEEADLVFATFPPHVARLYETAWLPAYRQLADTAWPRSN